MLLPTSKGRQEKNLKKNLFERKNKQPKYTTCTNVNQKHCYRLPLFVDRDSQEKEEAPVLL